MSSASTKTPDEVAKDSLENISSLVKTAKIYPNKSRRLNDRLNQIRNHFSSLNEKRAAFLVEKKILPAIVFLLKEIQTFLTRFTDHQYLAKCWSANIDVERFYDLTQKIFEMESLLDLSSTHDASSVEREDSQDKRDDHAHHKKVLEGLKLENVEQVVSGLEDQEIKIVEPLSSKPVQNLEEVRRKIQQIDSDFANYQVDGVKEDNLNANLSCDRTHANKIGEGKFGIVFKGTLNEEEVAVKYLREAVYLPEKQLQIRKEIARLHLLNHDNIVKFHGAQATSTPYYFVFEKLFCSLYSALYAHDENQKLELYKTNYRRKIEILLDVSRGVEYLHSLSLLHRNIKSPNVLISVNGVAKIGDFSFAMNKQDLNSSLAGGGSVRSSITGTGALLSAQKVYPAYLAPEIILHPNKDPLEYNDHTDTYAFGILLNEILTHTPPFPGLTFRNIMSKLQKSENNRPLLFAHNYQSSKQGNAVVLELKSLVERCWATVPDDRPSFNHIVLILQRLQPLADSLSVALSFEGKGTSGVAPILEEGVVSGGGVAFNTRKSFYERAPNDNNESMYNSLDMANDPNDLNMSRDAGDASPIRLKKIAPIIETYEKGFSKGFETTGEERGTGTTIRSYDRSFDRSMDMGEGSHLSSFVKIYDKFEKSMDKSQDPADLNKSKSRSFSLSKSVSGDHQLNKSRSLHGLFESAGPNSNNSNTLGSLEIDQVPSADRSDIVSVQVDQSNSHDNNNDKETLDLASIGIAMAQTNSLSRSTDSHHQPIAASRTVDSFDSHAPPRQEGGSGDKHQKTDSSLERTASTGGGGGGAADYVEPEDDMEYNHSKYIAQLFYDAGSCGKKDSQQKLEELAASNDLLAMGFLMGMLCYGSGMPKDMKKANEIAKNIYPLILQRADDENDSSRKFYQYIAGLCFEQGVGKEKNDVLAVKYYQLSADQGYAAALSNLGYCYKHGQGVPEDRYEAVRLYGLGADQNHATSLNNLGYCYQHGYGVEKDLQEAVRLYQRSAEQGHSTAQNNLGYCYQYGQGCEKNLAEAVRLYELSANQGCSFGQNSLGHCYKRGHGVPKDYTKAVYYYRLSAEQGHATAQNNLGYCYQYGQGVEVNYAEAVRWYKLSVEQGQASAENNLGFCYQCGIGVKKDLVEAVRLYKSSAEKGYAVAMYNLGLCYLNGMGVPNDADKAVQLIKSSAEQGHTAGQVKLAMCFEEGVGVTKDTREAIRWYVMAARRGDETAMKALKRIHG